MDPQQAREAVRSLFEEASRAAQDGDYRGAIRYAGQTMEIAQALGNQAVMARARAVIGQAMLKMGQYWDALGQISQALSYYAGNDPQRAASCRWNAAVVLRILGRHREALETYQAAAEYFAEQGDNDRLARIRKEMSLSSRLLEANQPFAQGNLVVAQSEDQGPWLLAKILQAAPDRVQVAFRGGGQKALPTSRVRPVAIIPGLRVLAAREQGGAWYPGTVESVSDHGATVQFDVGERAEVAFGGVRPEDLAPNDWCLVDRGGNGQYVFAKVLGRDAGRVRVVYDGGTQELVGVGRVALEPATRYEDPPVDAAQFVPREPFKGLQRPDLYCALEPPGEGWTVVPEHRRPAAALVSIVNPTSDITCTLSVAEGDLPLSAAVRRFLGAAAESERFGVHEQAPAAIGAEAASLFRYWTERAERWEGIALIAVHQGFSYCLAGAVRAQSLSEAEHVIRAAIARFGLLPRPDWSSRPPVGAWQGRAAPYRLTVPDRYWRRSETEPPVDLDLSYGSGEARMRVIAEPAGLPLAWLRTRAAGLHCADLEPGSAEIELDRPALIAGHPGIETILRGRLGGRPSVVGEICLAGATQHLRFVVWSAADAYPEVEIAWRGMVESLEWADQPLCSEPTDDAAAIVRDCAPSLRAPRVELAAHLTEKKARNFLGWASLRPGEHLLLAHDGTLLGSGKNGCVLTNQRLVWRGTFAAPVMVPHDRLQTAWADGRTLALRTDTQTLRIDLGGQGEAAQAFAHVLSQMTRGRVARRAADLMKQATDAVRAKDMPRARAVLEDAVAVHPYDATALYNLGAAAYHLGDHTAARHWFERCLRVQPDHPQARKALDSVAPQS